MAIVNNTTQQKLESTLIPRVWLRVRGMTKSKKISGVTYQKRVRNEWEKRLKNLYKKYVA